MADKEELEDWLPEDDEDEEEDSSTEPNDPVDEYLEQADDIGC